MEKAQEQEETRGDRMEVRTDLLITRGEMEQALNGWQEIRRRMGVSSAFCWQTVVDSFCYGAR